MCYSPQPFLLTSSGVMETTTTRVLQGRQDADGERAVRDVIAPVGRAARVLVLRFMLVFCCVTMCKAGAIWGPPR